MSIGYSGEFSVWQISCYYLKRLRSKTSSSCISSVEINHNTFIRASVNLLTKDLCLWIMVIYPNSLWKSCGTRILLLLEFLFPNKLILYSTHFVLSFLREHFITIQLLRKCRGDKSSTLHYYIWLIILSKHVSWWLGISNMILKTFEWKDLLFCAHNIHSFSYHLQRLVDFSIIRLSRIKVNS